MGETRRAFARPELRPYLPGRAQLRRVLGGAIVLAGRAWRAARGALRRVTAPQFKRDLAEDGRWASVYDGLEQAGRGVLVIAIAGIAGAGAVREMWPYVRPYGPILTSAGMIALLAGAWAVGPASGEQPPEKAVSTPVASFEPGPLPRPGPLTATEIAAAVRQIAAAGGWRGAHLDDVLAHLPGRSREELLAALAGAGIPVAEQLKLVLPGGRQRNRQGVRLSSLPAGLGEAPAEAAATPLVGPADAAPEAAPRTPHLTVHGNQ